MLGFTETVPYLPLRHLHPSAAGRWRALRPNPHFASERTGDWCQIFAFHEPAPAMISKRVINKILGHREGDRWQNPRLLTSSKVRN